MTSEKNYHEADTIQRMQKTCNAHSPKVQDLNIRNVQADRVRQIAVRVKIVAIEPTDAPEVEDAAMYENKLRKELAHSYARLDLPQRKLRRVMGCLRDSSVEFASTISPEVVLDPSSDETLDDEHVGDELCIDEAQLLPEHL